MTADSQLALQTAIYDALLADATLKTLISNPVRAYDHVPQDTATPYIVIGDAAAVDFDTKDTAGLDQTIRIHCWSEYRGQTETKNIMSAIVDALDEIALTVAGHDLALMRFVSSLTFVEEDGLTRQGVQTFRAITQIS